MSSITHKDGFTEVTRDFKTHKASGSPTLPSQPKPGSSEPPLGTPVRPKPRVKLNSSHSKWCRRKIQKLDICIRQIEAVPPKPQSFPDQGVTKR